ncbi:MAG: hypothetical protein P8H03_02285 [Emcibacteraceae bacterium]|nr:hypothetical protein [Emcibacteraceae bacterium]
MRIKHIISILIAALFFFASWTGVFVTVAWISIPIIIACLLIGLFFLLKGGEILNFQRDSDKIAIFMIICILIAALYNSNVQSIISVSTYITAFIILNILLREGIVTFGNYNSIKLANIIGVFFVVIFIYIAFYYEFFLDIPIQDYMPRTKDARATYFIFPRIYAFSTEPTHLGWYLNTLGIVALYHSFQYLKHRNYTKILLGALFFGSWVLTFSVGSFVFLPFATLFVYTVLFIKKQERININFKWALVCIFILTILVIFVQQTIDSNILTLFFERMIEKISYDGTGDNIRSIRFSSDLSIALQHVFLGKGPGYLSSMEQDSSLNLYLFLFLEAGIFAVVFLCIFYVLLFREIIFSKSEDSIIFGIAYIAGIAHLFTMTQFYHTNIWLLLAMFYLSNRKLNNEKRLKYNNYKIDKN